MFVFNAGYMVFYIYRPLTIFKFNLEKRVNNDY